MPKDLYWNCTRSHRPLESVYPFMDGIFGIEQGLDLDESTFEQAQGWFKRATAGAHDGDLDVRVATARPVHPH